MKKIVIVSMLVLVMICSLSTVVKATDTLDIGEFTTIEETPKTETPKEETPKEETPKAEETPKTEETPKDNSVAQTKNPQTGVKEEAPIIVITILGICVAVYAGRKIKKYNY